MWNFEYLNISRWILEAFDILDPLATEHLKYEFSKHLTIAFEYRKKL